MISTLDTIFARTSNPKLLDSDIPEHHLPTILEAAMTANDHGKLRPWRFMVFKNSGRKILANAFLEHEKFNNTNHKISSVEKKPFSAPAIICVIATPKDCKIPRRDQLFSAAAACQLITLSSYSLGVSSIWRTGKYADSDVVKACLNIEPWEEIIGFIYLGKNVPLRTNNKVSPDDKVTIFS